MVSKWWHDFSIALISFSSLTVTKWSSSALFFYTISDNILPWKDKSVQPTSSWAQWLPSSSIVFMIYDCLEGKETQQGCLFQKLLDLHGTHTKYESLSPVTFRPEKLQSVLKCRESPFEVSISPQSGPNNTLCFLSDFYKTLIENNSFLF